MVEYTITKVGKTKYRVDKSTNNVEKGKSKSIFCRRRKEMQHKYSKGNGNDFRKPELQLITGESSRRKLIVPNAGDKWNEYTREINRGE